MKTIIHIGQHKTATTSIQHYLKENRSKLLEDGCYIPEKIIGNNQPSHFMLNVYSLDKDHYSSGKEVIEKEKGENYLNEKLEFELKEDVTKTYKLAMKENCNKVVWSNEGLYLLNSVKEYQKLKNLFVEHSTEIEVVCCFRDVEEFRNSYTNQLKKQGITLSDDFNSYRYVKEDSWLFDYERKKLLLSKVFETCKYFDYDSEDNVKVFMENIGTWNWSGYNVRLKP